MPNVDIDPLSPTLVVVDNCVGDHLEVVGRGLLCESFGETDGTIEVVEGGGETVGTIKVVEGGGREKSKFRRAEGGGHVDGGSIKSLVSSTPPISLLSATIDGDKAEVNALQSITLSPSALASKLS